MNALTLINAARRALGLTELASLPNFPRQGKHSPLPLVLGLPSGVETGPDEVLLPPAAETIAKVWGAPAPVREVGAYRLRVPKPIQEWAHAPVPDPQPSDAEVLRWINAAREALGVAPLSQLSDDLAADLGSIHTDVWAIYSEESQARAVAGAWGQVCRITWWGEGDGPFWEVELPLPLILYGVHRGMI